MATRKDSETEPCRYPEKSGRKSKKEKQQKGGSVGRGKSEMLEKDRREEGSRKVEEREKGADRKEETSRAGSKKEKVGLDLGGLSGGKG